MRKPTRKRFVSQRRLTREQALWLCKAILTHYRTDGQQGHDPHDKFDLLNRVHKTGRYKRGRDWSTHPVGYDLQEVFYGSEKSGVREAWAALVALPVHQRLHAPEEYRTYTAYGLANENKLSIAVYKVTEVNVASHDDGYLGYVKQCFEQLQDDVQEIPDYDPKGRHGSRVKATAEKRN